MGLEIIHQSRLLADVLDTVRMDHAVPLQQVDVIDLAQSRYLGNVWKHPDLGKPLGDVMVRMFDEEGARRIVAATDNPKKQGLYEHSFEGLFRTRIPGLLPRVDMLTHEQKKRMREEPAWENVLNVSTLKNLDARRAIANSEGPPAVIYSSDILVGVVLPSGKRHIFHKLGREDKIWLDTIQQRADEIADITQSKSTWFWMSGTTMQTKWGGLRMAGRYYQVEMKPIKRKIIEALLSRDVPTAKALNIPHAVDILTDLPDQAIGKPIGMGVTWAMMQEGPVFEPDGVLYRTVQRKIEKGDYVSLDLDDLNAMVLGGVPCLDGIDDVEYVKPSSTHRLDALMTEWIAEESMMPVSGD